MTHDFLELSAFICIGLEREDALTTCREWVPRLWSEFWSRNHELHQVNRLGVWGLMSDPKIFLAPWGGERGRYLASWQVPAGTQPFGDWKVWKIPGRSWMRIPCRIDQIDEALDHAREVLRHHQEWRWEGSVHESYPDNFQNPAIDTLHLMVGLAAR